MKRRLAKKFRLKDYKEEGFLFSCHLSPITPTAPHPAKTHGEENPVENSKTLEKTPEDILDGFIQLIEERKLFCGASCSPTHFTGMVYPQAPYQRTSEKDKTAVLNYLTQTPGCIKAGVTKNFDANHPGKTPWDKTFEKLEDESLPHWTWKNPEK